MRWTWSEIFVKYHSLNLLRRGLSLNIASLMRTQCLLFVYVLTDVYLYAWSNGHADQTENNKLSVCDLITIIVDLIMQHEDLLCTNWPLCHEPNTNGQINCIGQRETLTFFDKTYLVRFIISCIYHWRLPKYLQSHDAQYFHKNSIVQGWTNPEPVAYKLYFSTYIYYKFIFSLSASMWAWTKNLFIRGT